MEMSKAFFFQNYKNPILGSGPIFPHQRGVAFCNSDCLFAAPLRAARRFTRSQRQVQTPTRFAIESTTYLATLLLVNPSMFPAQFTSEATARLFTGVSHA